MQNVTALVFLFTCCFVVDLNLTFITLGRGILKLFKFKFFYLLYIKLSLIIVI